MGRRKKNINDINETTNLVLPSNNVSSKYMPYIIGVIIFIVSILGLCHFLDIYNLNNIYNYFYPSNQKVNNTTNNIITNTNNIITLSDNPIVTDNNHFIVYGASGSGKTHFIKSYIKNKDITVFCKDQSEWKLITNNIYSQNDLHMLKDVTTFINKIVILDDLGNHLKQKDLSELFTFGRHNNTLVIVLAHKAKDVDNKIRSNINSIYITVNNNRIFFDEIKKTYLYPFDLSQYGNLEYGIIKVDLLKNNYQVYDKDFNLFYDSSNDIIKHNIIKEEVEPSLLNKIRDVMHDVSPILKEGVIIKNNILSISGL